MKHPLPTSGRGEGPSIHRQRGWAGLVMLLVVVVIVAFLVKDALLKYLAPAQTVQREVPKNALDPAASDVNAPANSMDRVRELQDMLQKESGKRGDP